jgi:hypothetical protein
MRTVNMGGELKLASNVRVFFGAADSNEFLIYDYSDVQLNLVTRQIVLSDEKNDLTFVGFLKEGKIEGEWYSSIVGKVGSFEAKKNEYPQVADGSVPVQSLSGFYKGTVVNTNPQANLPERASISFVSTQDFSGDKPSLKISGRARLYLGDFDSLEYIEMDFENIQFNAYSRFLTAKTKDHGFTFKGTISPEGSFEGMVYSDALGMVGTFKLERFPK